MDPDLWRVDRYLDFLDARRELLANAANQFLDSLVADAVPEPIAGEPVMERDVVTVPGAITDSDEERLILDCAEWVEEHGLPSGELMYECADSQTGEALAVFDLAWPEGLQEGLSVPVALLVDEPDETIRAANRAGFRYFTSIESFKEYVAREVLALDSVAAD